MGGLKVIMQSSCVGALTITARAVQQGTMSVGDFVVSE